MLYFQICSISFFGNVFIPCLVYMPAGGVFCLLVLFPHLQWLHQKCLKLKKKWSTTNSMLVSIIRHFLVLIGEIEPLQPMSGSETWGGAILNRQSKKQWCIIWCIFMLVNPKALWSWRKFRGTGEGRVLLRQAERTMILSWGWEDQ